MSEDLSVSQDVAAPAEVVYDLVADVTRMGEWSPETVGCVWIGGAAGPVVGARFRGRNQHGWRRWRTTCTVVEAERGRRFAFRVTSASKVVATWRYEFEPIASGCRVTETWIDQRTPFVVRAGTVISGVSDRRAHNAAGMAETLRRLAAVAAATTLSTSPPPS